MTITAAPFALVDWAGWKIATSGPKPKVYASDGVSVSEFQKVIENVEGGNGIPDLKVGRDKIFLFEYYGKKTNCYGRFKDNKAINHWRYTLVGAHPDTAPDAIDMAERRAPIRRVFRWFLNWPGRRPAFRGAVSGCARVDPSRPNRWQLQSDDDRRAFSCGGKPVNSPRCFGFYAPPKLAMIPAALRDLPSVKLLRLALPF